MSTRFGRVAERTGYGDGNDDVRSALPQRVRSLSERCSGCHDVVDEQQAFPGEAAPAGSEAGGGSQAFRSGQARLACAPSPPDERIIEERHGELGREAAGYQS